MRRRRPGRRHRVRGRRLTLSVEELVEELERGERRAVARLLTLVEDGSPDDVRRVVGAVHSRTGRAQLVGVTGSPGVGKSSLTDALLSEWRGRGATVAVLAVDPSSPFSGGALLGDRVRMQGHHADAGVFIRSMAARGHLGGIAVATPQAIAVLDAAAFDIVVVETVGVGQSEIEVASTADTTVVVVAPGMGDSIQAAKAGILEVADVLVVNKADQSGAGKTVSELQGMLELSHDLGSERAWEPPVLRAVAVRGEGVAELADTIERHRSHLVSTGDLDVRRRERALRHVRALTLVALQRRIAGLEADGAGLLDALAARVATRELDPYAAADELVEALDAR